MSNEVELTKKSASGEKFVGRVSHQMDHESIEYEEEDEWKNKPQ